MPADHKSSFRLLFLCLACIGIGQSMLFAILPPAAREIGISPFEVSIIFATSASIWVFLSPMWGRRSDVVGRRQVILIGLLGFALSMTLLATVIEIGLRGLLPIVIVYPLMIASRSVFALLGSGTGPASQAYVADRTTRAERTAGVALVSAALALGQILGPALGALLAFIALLAPIYFAAGLAVISAGMIWAFLPEEGPPIEKGAPRPPRMSLRDRRVIPFLIIAASMQAVRSTTVITLAFYLQDVLRLSAKQTVQYSGVGFVVLAVAVLFAQLVVTQRFRPSARWMILSGLPLALVSFLFLALGRTFYIYLVALVLLGLGLGLVRPGNAAGASLSVEPNEQGAVAGLTAAIGVIGNVIGPLIGTGIYQAAHSGPYFLNAAIMALALVFAATNRRLRRLRT